MSTKILSVNQDLFLWHPDVSSSPNCSLATDVVVACLTKSVDLNGSFERPEVTPSGRESPLPVWQIVLFGFLACCIGVVTVGGNLVVILSFVVEKSIRQPTNYFIASLAVSDLLIGSVSMPLYTVYLLSGQKWQLGEELCDLWLSIDYTACLCSIYTVFCITADRFCSVKLPAKYRKWRTGRKVVAIICLTWTVPMAVFFTSIFGWQHFVGRRTVPSGRCYVQYMEDALFNCFLQIGYFWITLAAMFVLYAGIYRVALDLHRRSAAQREKTMSCLVSMAGRTVTQIGSVISISRNPCRLEGFAMHTEPDPSNGRLTQVQNEKRWVATATNSHSRLEYSGSVSFAHADVSFFPFLFSRSENNHAETNQQTEPREAVIGSSQPNSSTNPLSLAEDEPRTNDVTDCNSTDQINRTQPSVLNIPRITVSVLPLQTTVAAEAVVAEPERLVDLAYMDDEAVRHQEAPSDLVITEADAHELEVLLPNPAYEPGICAQRLNRFRLAGAGKRSKSVEQRSRLNPIIEIEMHAKRDCNDLAHKTRSVESDPDQPSASKSSKHSDDNGSSSADDSDDSDDTALRHNDSTPTSTATSQASACVLKAPQQQLHQQLQHLEPVAKLIRYGLRSRHSSESRSAQLQQMRCDNRTRKALRTITLILGAFVVCWIPWHVLSMIIGFCNDRSRCVRPILYDISYWLCYLNSPINPFCYAFANQQFKKTFIRLIRLDWRRNN